MTRDNTLKAILFATKDKPPPEKNGDGHMFTRLQEVDVVILFLGSSHAYRSFDPRLFTAAGYTFNLASSAQTPIQTEILLKAYLDKLKSGNDHIGGVANDIHHKWCRVIPGYHREWIQRRHLKKNAEKKTHM